MDPTDLRTIARSRSSIWESSGYTWTCEIGPQTDNPAAWLTLRSEKADAFVKVWTSGDAEMDWGIEGAAHARHYDLASIDDLEACVDDLEANLAAYS